jgi:septal ring factor EnvC (AmiA/AmiB activator)
MLLIGNTKDRLGWFVGIAFCVMSISILMAADMTFEDAQMRTVHARKAMEAKKKELDILIEEAQKRRSVVTGLTTKLKSAQTALDAAEAQVLSIEKEHESLQKSWAEEAKRLKEIYTKERR